MTARVVVLGAGTGGTAVANRLHRLCARSTMPVDITVIDSDDHHLYQPGLLFVPFGRGDVEHLTRSRRRLLAAGIAYRTAVVDRVAIDVNEVSLGDGTTLGYDVLVVATGATLALEETEGLSGAGWRERVHTFYDADGATALQDSLAAFEGGRLVVNVIDMPIKCPVAPLEFCFLADDYFTRRGMRGRVDLTYVTPLDAAFTKPVAAQRLSGLLETKGIELVTEFNTGRVDGAAGRLISYDGRQIDFDLAVIIPLHTGAAYIQRSTGLGDELNFVPCDARTLQAKAAPNIFVIGDASDLPASKAGSVAHFQCPVVVENIKRYLDGEPLQPGFDGHTNCFIETGHGKALLIDFNYDTEPFPGHYPARLGLPLLKESRLDHVGKLGFQWLYWHALLPGYDIPGIGTSMPRAGKQLTGPTGGGNK